MKIKRELTFAGMIIVGCLLVGIGAGFSYEYGLFLTSGIVPLVLTILIVIGLTGFLEYMGSSERVKSEYRPSTSFKKAMDAFQQAYIAQAARRNANWPQEIHEKELALLELASIPEQYGVNIRELLDLYGLEGEGIIGKSRVEWALWEQQNDPLQYAHVSADFLIQQQPTSFHNLETIFSKERHKGAVINERAN